MGREETGTTDRTALFIHSNHPSTRLKIGIYSPRADKTELNM